MGGGGEKAENSRQLTSAACPNFLTLVSRPGKLPGLGFPRNCYGPKSMGWSKASSQFRTNILWLCEEWKSALKPVTFLANRCDLEGHRELVG